MGFSKCWKCSSQFWMPDDLEAAARRDSNIAVYCAHGHRGVFTEKPTEEDRLRLERDRLVQRVAEKDDEINRQRLRAELTERRLSAAKGRVTRIKNRVGHGVCPCCNRTFTDLQRHMASKHSDYTKQGDIEPTTLN